MQRWDGRGWVTGLKTGHYNSGAFRRLRKAPLERKSGHRRDAAEVWLLRYCTINVNGVLVVVLPEVAVTVTV